MELKEYLNQKDPVRFPSVILKGSQINIHHTIKVSSGETRSLVSIKSRNLLVKDLQYVMIGGRLWVMDSDGNPRTKSVFSVEGI